jgi:hypothetical protein
MALIDTFIVFRNNTIIKLDTLLTDYSHLSNNDLMTRVVAVFSDVTGVFMFLDFMIEACQNAAVKTAGQKYSNLHTEATGYYEHILFLHVDEPDGSFKAGLAKLQGVLKTLASAESEAYITQLQLHLDEATSAGVRNHLTEKHVEIMV